VKATNEIKQKINMRFYHLILYYVKLVIKILVMLGGWFEILEFAPPKVSSSIPTSANFGGLSPYRAC